MSLLEELKSVPVGSLKEYPGNARRGDVGAIAESLRVNGQFAPLVVQRSTGYVLAGNHTLKAAKRLGWESVGAVFVDVDDDRARKIVLAANRTADRATYDDAALLDLLTSLDDGLAGTGWTEDEFHALMASVTEQALDAPEEPVQPHDAPEEQPSTVWGVIVTCESETDQVTLLAELSAQGRTVRALVG